MDLTNLDDIAAAFSIGATTMAGFWGLAMLWINSRFAALNERLDEFHEDHKELENRFYEYVKEH